MRSLLLPCRPLLYCAAFLIATQRLQAQNAPRKTVTTSQSNTKALTSKIIAGSGGTFGYDIYRNGKLLIHQPTVPALAGNKGFDTRAGAEKVAGLVIKKIGKGEMPPTISPAEMKKLNAL